MNKNNKKSLGLTKVPGGFPDRLGIVERYLYDNDCAERFYEKLNNQSEAKKERFEVLEIKEEICWCPSQIYIFIRYKGTDYQIYARWRWVDPWEIFLSTSLDNPYSGHIFPLNEKEFLQSDDLDDVKKFMILAAWKNLKEAFEK